MRLIILVVLILGANASSDELWSEWKRIYNKRYNTVVDESRRRHIWDQNLRRVAEHNLRYELGLVSYTMGLNRFADRTTEDIRGKRWQNVPATVQLSTKSTMYTTQQSSDAIPDSFDWRDYGYVGPVDCDSCWAFSITGAVEAQYLKKYGRSKTFSAQQILDCTIDYGDLGCRGGLAEPAYEYLKEHGLYEESVYPYVGMVSRCWADAKKGSLRVTDYLVVHDGNETELKAMVFQQGPVTVTIDALRDFALYSGGIYHSDECWNDRQSVTRVGLLVGYGTENGEDYWIVKNSWGTRWGEDGYIRMARNRDNMCGIATLASVPKVMRTA